MSSASPSSFTFAAQTAGGEPLSGTIDAPSLSDADRRLKALQLRVVALEPAAAGAETARPPRGTGRLRGSDFQLFNTQLAHLSEAGLPIEHGLRLIADDMRSGRLAKAVRGIADELDAGGSLADVLQQHAGKFPPLYGQLVSAGIAAGNLPGVLLNLGRHLEAVARMRRSLWRAFTYPVFVLLALFVVLMVLGLMVFPQYNDIFRSFHTDLPVITRFAIAVSEGIVHHWKSIVVIVGLVVISIPLLWELLGRLNQRQRLVEMFVMPLPLIGRALRWNLLARWTDALKLGVQAGLDLPGAIALAGDAVGSPALSDDGGKLVAALQSGQPVDRASGMRLIPPTLLSVLSMTSGRDDLPAALATLSSMFQQQAEVRVALIPVTLTPILIVAIAIIVIMAVLAMFAPMITLISAVSGPVRR